MSVTAAASRGAAVPGLRGRFRAAAFRAASLLSLGLALSTAFPSRATEPASRPVYLIDVPFEAPQDTTLYRVDPVTGVLEVAADLGADHSPFYGLAAASETVMYATGSDPTGQACLEPGCLLLRIELQPGVPVPSAVDVIGPINDRGQEVGKVTGLTFRADDSLWAIGQDTDGLYVLDPASGAATLIGVVDLDLYGGDITFTDDDRLLFWTNAGPAAGLYELDPATAQASALELRPYTGFAGFAARGHGQLIYGSSPSLDRIVELDAVSGFTGREVPLSLGGAAFDHTRGDLDSPRCLDDAECGDGDSCTLDLCAPGGCRHVAQEGCCTAVATLDDTCDGVDDDCDGWVDEDYTASAEVCDGLDNDCNGLIDDVPPPPGLPVATIELAAGDFQLRWTPVAGATAYDVVRGDGQALRDSGGEYSGAALTCVADGLPGSHLTLSPSPAAGTFIWYLVRPENCGMPGSYETGQPSQKVIRGPAIAGAPGACP